MTESEMDTETETDKESFSDRWTLRTLLINELYRLLEGACHFKSFRLLSISVSGRLSLLSVSRSRCSPVII